MHRLLAFILMAAPVWPCVCVNTSSACSWVGGPSVIFVADVLVDSGEGWGTGPAKVAMVEPLQNVPVGLKETTIDTMAGSSCYRRLQAGRRFVIITSGPRYSVSGCNDSFALAGNEHILAAMRSSLNGSAPTLVGRVLKNAGRYSRKGGVGSAEVVLQKGELHHRAIAESDGRYVIHGLEQGRYQIRVSKEGFVADQEFNNRWSGRNALNPKNNTVEPVKDMPGEIEILSKGCQIRDLAMWPLGTIRGKVRKSDGGAVQGVPVQAFGFDQRGERESSPLRTALTDSEGKFQITPLPAGPYVVGVNAATYADENPYPPTLFDGGRIVPVEESGSVSEIDFAVPEPRKPASLRILIVGPDGEPFRGASARLDTPTGIQRWFSRSNRDEKGEILAPVYVGERYVVRVTYYSLGGELGGLANVEVNDKEVFVTLHLRHVAQGRK